jgi:hypothetical protein
MRLPRPQDDFRLLLERSQNQKAEAERLRKESEGLKARIQSVERAAEESLRSAMRIESAPFRRMDFRMDHEEGPARTHQCLFARKLTSNASTPMAPRTRVMLSILKPA